MLMCLTESVRSYYNLIVKKAGQFLTDLQVSLLKFALSLRSYSPAIHASQQVCCDLNVMKFTLTELEKTSTVVLSLHPIIDPDQLPSFSAIIHNCFGVIYWNNNNRY